MSSGPCPDCFSGTASTATPTGTITTIHGLPTYIAMPDDGINPKGLVVIVADAFGWDLANNRVLADRYAKNGGFLIYLPDFMAGNSFDGSTMALMDKIMKPASWFKTLLYKPFYILRAIIVAIPFLIKNRASVTTPRVFDFVKALRTSPPPFPTNDLKVGAAGFCFGGKYTVLLAQDMPSSRVQPNEVGSSSRELVPLIDCGFTAHPSLLNVPKDIEAVKRPLSVAVGSEDSALKPDLIVKMKEILEKKGDDHECVIMPGAKHGFAIRMDPKDEIQMGFAAEAETQAIRWFTKWFA